MFQVSIKSISLALLFSLVILGCGGDSGDANTGTTHPQEVSNILFAHGVGSSSETWNYFSQVTANESDREWVIYKTSVSKTGTIKERASQLADYINAQNLAENSLLVVGHSMGGLDLRYIISEGHQNQSEDNKYYQATRKIHKFYTLATPHKGSDAAESFENENGALHDLSSSNMAIFNIEHPYIHSSVGSRLIPMFAFRFSCEDEQKHDGVVDVDKQILDGAPYSEEIISGKHTSGLERVCNENVIEELLQENIIDDILKNNTPI